MSREELNRLIADDAYAASFQTMGQYRIALLKATDSAQDFARAQEWKNPLLSILTDAAKWLHAAYDRPPQTPEAKAMLDLIDLAIQFAGEVESYAAPAVAPEGCTPADAQMLRAANHGLAAENDYLRRRLRPFAQIASSPLSWAMVEYCVDGDPEKQTLQAPQMQRAFNRAADALREHAAPAQAETHPLQCPHGGQCGVGGYCDDCPARSERAEQQGDGGARIKHIQSLMLKWINTRPGNPAEAVWHEIERELKATIVQPSARVALSERTRAYLSDHAELFRLNGDAVLADELAAILAASSAQTGESKP